MLSFENLIPIPFRFSVEAIEYMIRVFWKILKYNSAKVAIGSGYIRSVLYTLTLFKGKKSKIDTLFKALNRKMTPYLRERR